MNEWIEMNSKIAVIRVIVLLKNTQKKEKEV